MHFIDCFYFIYLRLLRFLFLRPSPCLLSASGAARLDAPSAGLIVQAVHVCRCPHSKVFRLQSNI